MRWCPYCDDGLQYIPSAELWHCYGCDQDHSRLTLDEYEKRHPPMGDQVDFEVRNTTIPITSEQEWEGRWYDPAYNPGSETAPSKETGMQEMTRVFGNTSVFPYALNDIKYWVVKRKSGEMVRYNLTDNATVTGSGPSSGAYKPGTTALAKSVSYGSGYSDWCKHDATLLPVFEAGDKQLFICDADGARSGKDKFDFIIDGGDVISELYARPKLGILSGDESLSKILAKFNLASFPTTRTLKIAWADRKAPLLHPSFWPALSAKLKGRVMTCCQGGHGRSGTSLVCLMMVLNPEYSAYEAICHLRAMHCPRAIESKEQHEYIDEVADFLGREQNSAKVGEVKSFKDAFLALECKSSQPYQERLEKKGGKV